MPKMPTTPILERPIMAFGDELIDAIIADAEAATDAVIAAAKAVTA